MSATNHRWEKLGAAHVRCSKCGAEGEGVVIYATKVERSPRARWKRGGSSTWSANKPGCAAPRAEASTDAREASQRARWHRRRERAGGAP